MMSASKKKQIVTLPPTRISSIMKSTPDVSSVSADSVLVAARAAELFIAYLARQGMAVSMNGKSLDYHHLSTVVADDPRLEFLKDMIPHKMKIHEYQDILSKVEEREADSGRTVLVSEVKALQADEEEGEDDEVEEMDQDADGPVQEQGADDDDEDDEEQAMTSGQQEDEDDEEDEEEGQEQEEDEDEDDEDEEDNGVENDEDEESDEEEHENANQNAELDDDDEEEEEDQKEEEEEDDDEDEEEERKEEEDDDDDDDEEDDQVIVISDSE